MTLNVRSCFAACLALATLATHEIKGDEIVLFPSRDTTIYENSDNSNSEGIHLFSGATAARNAGAARRALLAFDVAGSLPANATINSASLSLTVNRIPSNFVTSDFGVHTLTQDWIEGSSDAGGQEGRGGVVSGDDTTWVSTGITNWQNEGGDFGENASAVSSVAGLGEYAWSSPGMVADIESWLTGDNFGWILVGDESTPKTAKRFASRFNGTESSRPSLTIDFDVTGSILGDFDGDGTLNAGDTGHICFAINNGQNPADFDLDGNQVVDLDDLQFWIENLRGTFLGDLDLNGTVEFADFLGLSAAFGQMPGNPAEPSTADSWSLGDFDCDRVVGFSDFLLIAGNFGRTDVAAASVPEPTTSAMLMVGLLGLCVRRRRS